LDNSKTRFYILRIKKVLTHQRRVHNMARVKFIESVDEAQGKAKEAYEKLTSYGTKSPT
jgi:hypothetical protein